MSRYFLALVAVLAAASCAARVDAQTCACPPNDGGPRQMTASQVVTNIKSLTSQSQALQRPATTITIVSGPLVVVGQGPFPIIIQGFVRIIITATKAMVSAPSTLLT